jgi:transcriptional regulator with PAS, ATPase and Fis domain
MVREQVDGLLRQLARARRLPVVLLQGETGTGKGLLSKYLHRHGPRARGPFVDLNCAAIPDTLLEAELFGFERGAFTDARHAKPGLFQAAQGGTLFLDEVGLLSLPLQAKLLKALEERTVRRLGSTRLTAVDVWVIAASNENLAGAVRAGRVREDFYHRIAALVVHLPPLRERSEDIGVLSDHFLARFCNEYGLPRKHLGPGALAALRAYSWPGNVRELANVIERATLLADGEELLPDVLQLPASDKRVSHI